MRVIQKEDKKIDVSLAPQWQHILKYFEDFNPFKCKFPERINYWRDHNLVGDQQRAFNIWCALKYCVHKKGLELGSAGVHTPFCLSTDIAEKSGVEKVVDAEKLPFEDKTFDLILANHVFEHCWNPKKTFSEWMRVLKKNGHIALIVPDDRHFDTFSWDKTHKFAYTPKRLLKVVSDNCEIISLDNLQNNFSFELIGRKR